MTPKEKAKELIDKMNGREVLLEQWENASSYARNDLKRKCAIVVDVILSNSRTSIPIVVFSEELVCDEEYWKEVGREINAYSPKKEETK